MPNDTNKPIRIDPTENVIALTKASTQRQDDIRETNDRRVNAELAHLRNVSDLRADHAREIRDLESRRLDAIRQVDVTAVKTEADRALAAIQTLAATTATNAENLRNALTNTAATIATQTSNTVTQITERIAALEKSSYEGKGKSALSDPMMSELITEVRGLRESRAVVVGKSAGLSAGWAILIGVAGFMTSLIAVGTFVFITLRK